VSELYSDILILRLAARSRLPSAAMSGVFAFCQGDAGYQRQRPLVKRCASWSHGDYPIVRLIPGHD
jgi:hypothetical protein